MTPEVRESKIMSKQRRTRLMLEHILSKLSGNEGKVHTWLSQFVTSHRPGLKEWQSFPDWESKLKWMSSSIETDWDEVERLMSNHPFSCIIDQNIRGEILSQTSSVV